MASFIFQLVCSLEENIDEKNYIVDSNVRPKDLEDASK